MLCLKVYLIDKSPHLVNHYIYQSEYRLLIHLSDKQTHDSYANHAQCADYQMGHVQTTVCRPSIVS